MQRRRVVVGLTGNYGMGKSFVMSVFGGLGAFTVDADEIVRGLLAEKKVIEKVRKLLGGGVFDREGRLIKKKVSDVVFKDKKLRAALEDILHPLVFRRLGEMIKRAKEKVIIVEAPVIFERGYEEFFDKVVVVAAEEELAVKRLSKKGIGREETLLRLRCQMPVGEKAKRADFVIENSGSKTATKRQVEKIYGELLR